MIRFNFTVCILFLFAIVEQALANFLFIPAGGTSCGLSGKRRKISEGEILLWCQVASSDILSFFKLILGVMQLETDLICSQRFLLFLPATAYQPRRAFWYLIATPWCCWTPPPSLQLSAKLFAASLARSTRMGQWIDDYLQVQKRLRTKPCYGSFWGWQWLKCAGTELWWISIMYGHLGWDTQYNLGTSTGRFETETECCF